LSTKFLFEKYCPKFLDPIRLKISNSPSAIRIANGAFWSLFGALISRGLTLISSIIIARFLGTKGFGEFGVIQSTIGMFGMFAGLGLGMTATKYIAQYRESDKIKTGRIISLTLFVAIIASAIISLVLFIISPWLAYTTLKAPYLTSSLQIGSVYLFMLSITGLQNGILSGFEAFKAIAIRSVISGLSTFPLMVSGVYFFGLNGAVWGLVGSSILNVILNNIEIKKIANSQNFKIKLDDCMKEKYILHEFALPAFLGGVMVGPVNWICNTILINQTNGYSEMGIYNAAYQWLIIILFVPGTLAGIILPLLTNLNQNENSKNYFRVLKYNIIINILIATVISITIILFSKLIMLSYGYSFIAGQKVLIILALTAVLISYNNVVGQAIASKGKMWIGFILNFLWAIILILTSLYFARNIQGAIGLSKAFLIAYLFHTINSTIVINYMLNRNK
jgi:O-antigen/teichoic acid export membrane protein